MSRRIIDEVFNSEEVRRRMEEEMWRRRERRANMIVGAWIGIAIFLLLLENASFWAWLSINNLMMDYVLAGLFGSSIIASLIFTNLDLEESNTARRWASWDLRVALERSLKVLFRFTFIYLIASIAVLCLAWLSPVLSPPAVFPQVP
jgi:fatty acid desaturase